MLDHLRQGRDCFQRAAWTDAYRALRLADEVAPLGVEDLDRLSTSAYMVGRDLEFEQLVMRQHRAHVRADEPDRAARCAFWLGLALLFRGEVAQANAWIARGQRLIAGHDCVEHGYLLLPLAEQQLRAGRVADARDAATTAVSLGDRFGDADLLALARHVQGRALILLDQVIGGLELLDETMLAVVGGDLSPIVTGLMYCSVIGACQQVYALNRAREWTFALSAWCDRQAEAVAFSGNCLVHRAEIMQFQGKWREALAEACVACERSERAERKPPAAALYEQAEIHRLRGEYAKAEEAYRGASRMGRDPEPGLALLRMAQGQIETASAAIHQLVSATPDRMRRARLLPAYLEIMLYFFRRPYGNGWALVGDAGYNRDPITAQGISDSFIEAERLADALHAILSGAGHTRELMAAYESGRNARVRPMYDFTSQLAALEPPPPPMQALFGALRGNQEATNAFLSAITGAIPLPDFMSDENIGRIMAAAQHVGHV